ncbi:hypothetical protein [uncultured Paludibaculum sp.]|uniref:hypothetical protein n=1 Tax=uncultured Paludibaculum sp. TaxID=1765020 RepID=UPI002AAC175F|nr:hypothetical protein [uncultured Paludibaculum sp.]
MTPRNPRGFVNARVDAAGRLKLPAKYQEFLKALSDRNLFATMYEGMARIYSNGSFERNLSLLADQPDLYETMAKFGDMFGSDVDVDPQGRITIPQNLRKLLGLENTSVYLRFDDDVISVYSEGQYQVEEARLQAKIAEALQAAKAKGFRL